jgi:hypothetical protein
MIIFNLKSCYGKIGTPHQHWCLKSPPSPSQKALHHMATISFSSIKSSKGLVFLNQLLIFDVSNTKGRNDHFI